MSVTYTKEIFKSNVWGDKTDENGKVVTDDNDKPIRVVIDTVNSKYLFDTNGNPVIDPTSITASNPTGRPYIIPADMDFNAILKTYSDQLHTQIDVAQILLDFRTSGNLDLQRTGIDGSRYRIVDENGNFHEGFVSDYTSAASLYFGAVSAALTVPANVAEIGGGMLNFWNSLTYGSIDTSGEYGNNPNNVENIREGLSYYQSNISTSPILDMFVKAVDLWADLTYYALHTKDVDISEEFADTFFFNITKQVDTVTSWTQTLLNAGVDLLNSVKNSDAEVVTSVETFLTNIIESSPTKESVFNSMSTTNVLQNEYQLNKLYNDGLLSDAFKNIYTQQVSNFLVSDSYFTPVVDVPHIYDGFDGLSLDPIGAFYESVTPANDQALSIADKTYVLLDSLNKGVTSNALSLKDTNHDGKLTTTELNGLNMWQDLNENGIAESGEITTLASQNITSIRSEDYGFSQKIA